MPKTSGGAFGTALITGGTATNLGLVTPTGVEYKLAHAGIPVGLAPTGTMANNGAVTLGTALNTTYAASYLQYPAGAIAAGVPAAADFYWTVMSSATVGQVFNNTMSANVDANGMPTAPASPTAFATTGPGAFTGATGSNITLYTMTVGAGAMGSSGIYRMVFLTAANATAGARTVITTFGGTQLSNPSLNNVLGHQITHWTRNRASASAQSSTGMFSSSASAAGLAPVYTTVNTGSAVSVTVAVNRAVATDTFMIDSIEEWITNQ